MHLLQRYKHKLKKKGFSLQDKRTTIDYDIDDHVGVIVQMYGSIWPKVFPYCAFNVFVVGLVAFLKRSKHIELDLSFSGKGHTILSLMVSFLIVTRCTMAYKRWTEARSLLSQLMRENRELIQHMATFTRHDMSPSAVQWRYEVTHHAAILLRLIASVLDHGIKQEDTTAVIEVAEKDIINRVVEGSIEREPVLMTLFLRASIASHVKTLQEPLCFGEEVILLNSTSGIFSAYHGLLLLVNTPFPFPLVQMTRTFLVVWVFTLPFALCHELHEVIPVMFMTFLLTYGFLGLEFVNIEMDDPFGTDPNDFDCLSLAKKIFHSMCLVIYDVDGYEAAINLQKTMFGGHLHQSSSHLSDHDDQSVQGKGSNHSLSSLGDYELLPDAKSFS